MSISVPSANHRDSAPDEHTESNWRRFSSTAIRWDFWLIASDFKPEVRSKARQVGKPPGLAFEPEMTDSPGVRVRVWVKTWSEIIEAADQRLRYVKKELNSDPSVEDALLWVNRPDTVHPFERVVSVEATGADVPHH